MDNSNAKKTSNPIRILNLEITLALCAILISIASFYATYLQASAAEKQVTAMTLPLLNFGHGNYSSEEKRAKVTYFINNVGVGPARIKSAHLVYEGQRYNALFDYFDACCKAEYKSAIEETKQNVNYGLLTSGIENRILLNGDDIRFIQLPKAEVNSALWNKLNDVRWKTEMEVCYCSLLDNCYWLKSQNEITETNSCSI